MGGRDKGRPCTNMYHLILSPGSPPHNMGQRRVPERPTLHRPQRLSAKTQSLCVPAHACASSCLAGLHPQLAPTCLPRAGTQQPQAGSGCLQQALAPRMSSHRPHPNAPSTTYTAFTCQSGLNEEHVSSGKRQSHPTPSLPTPQTGGQGHVGSQSSH